MLADDSTNPPVKRSFLALLQNTRYCNREAMVKRECTCAIINEIMGNPLNNGK